MLDVSEFYKEHPQPAPKPVQRALNGFAPAEAVSAEKAAADAMHMRNSGYRKITGDAVRWLLAGHAIFTVRNVRTGNRFTYSVRKSKDDDTLYWVAVLRGPENTSDYAPLGRILRRDANAVFLRNRSSRISEDAQSHKVFKWFFEHLCANALPEYVEIWHAGRCCVCGRLLTVPESINAGIGPECASRPY